MILQYITPLSFSSCSSQHWYANHPWCLIESLQQIVPNHCWLWSAQVVITDKFKWYPVSWQKREGNEIVETWVVFCHDLTCNWFELWCIIIGSKQARALWKDDDHVEEREGMQIGYTQFNPWTHVSCVLECNWMNVKWVLKLSTHLTYFTFYYIMSTFPFDTLSHFCW